jgi:hypothetical protein
LINEGNIKVNWLENNIDYDPVFKDSENNDYSLANNSPCIDSGTSFFTWQGDTLINLSNSQYKGLAPDMGAFEFDSLTAISSDIQVPNVFCLNQNFPNPFNANTVISYYLPKAVHVNLSIYNILGQKVFDLTNKRQLAGNHKITWNAAAFSSGIYYYKIEAGEKSLVKKCIFRIALALLIASR